MAPRGSRSQASAGRESRSSTLNSKSSSRGGGIQKRRAGGARIDTDGDLDMGTATARRPRGGASVDSKMTSTRSGPRGPSIRGVSRAAQTMIKHLNDGESSRLASRITSSANIRTAKYKTNSGPLVYLRVHGLKESKASKNPDGGRADLLAFLERKATAFTSGRQKRQVLIKKSHLVGDYFFIGASKEDAEELMKVNTFVFAGSPLEITESDDGLGHNGGKATESKDTQELRAKLQTILSQRYLGGNKLLKLDTLSTDTELVNLGMFENRERALKTFKGLMAICDGLFKTAKEKQDAIESISLANNNIDDVTQVESVATTFPRLRNLDMSGNQISSIQGLDQWKGKFRELETIYTVGNPIELTDPNYQASLLEMFPQLQSINGVQLRTPEQIAEKKAAMFPKPIPQNGPDFRDVNGIGESFLLEFFAAYDNDRHGLASRLYDETSQFSLSIDTTSVRDSTAPPPIPWASYIKTSRNLHKVNSINARIQRLFQGTNLIANLWKSLPLTKHPSIKDDMSKYIMDCHPLPGLVDPNGQSSAGVDGLIVCVHGEFEECDQQTQKTGLRSFSRSFVLGPGRPGRGAIRVVSDMLSLRAYSPLPNVFAAANPQPADQPNQQQAMIAELSRQTGMTPQYSEMCLTQVNWEFDKALAMFSERKSQLPAEAFSTMPQQG